MKTFRLLAVAITAISLHAHAECNQPRWPGKIPDGSTASQDEMVAALKAMKQYDAEVNAYGACLEQSGISKAVASDKQNAAVSELQSVAAKFNEQVRIFKKRS